MNKYSTNLAISHPDIARQWHFKKNSSLLPTSVSAGSHKKVWWCCGKGHEWAACIGSRARGVGCPYCRNKSVNNENCLKTLRPDLGAQWHPSKNFPLTSNDVTPGSDKNIWWVCRSGHEWQTQVYHRSKGRGCPYCSNRAIGPGNCLEKLNPGLAKQWHPRNLLTPREVSVSSNKKVWWVCVSGHEWQAVVSSRSSGTGCPYCSGRYATGQVNLAVLYPDIAKQWHPYKNGDIRPDSVKPHTHKYVWWQCHKGHEWQAWISSRRVYGASCPSCKRIAAAENRLVSKRQKVAKTRHPIGYRIANSKNSLAVMRPDIAITWHPTRNGNLAPGDVTPGSDKKVWWVCKKKHEWFAGIYSRSLSRVSGCPHCSSKTSIMELRVLSEMLFLFKEVEHREKIFGVECDVYVPKYKLGVEVDGVYWHKDKINKDFKKTRHLSDHGVILIRVREKGLPRISEADVLFSNRDSHLSVMTRLAEAIVRFVQLPENVKNYISKYISDGEIKNEEAFLQLLAKLPSPLPGKSLSEINPALAGEWDSAKNGALAASDVECGSKIKVWWLCSRKKHGWKATVSSRSGGTGCPSCSGRVATSEKNLLAFNPSLAGEWHPTRNGGLNPAAITPHSHKTVWWRCIQGHEWEMSILSRGKGKGCPTCYKKTSHEASLALLNPKLAKEWHPTKNAALTPNDVRACSSKNIWWLCANGHAWSAVVASRNAGAGCPFCTNRRVWQGNSLLIKFPEVAKQWHPTKNRNLTPAEVVPGAFRRVWWVCGQGHQWEAHIYSRTAGNGCPFCSGLRVKPETSLQAVNPRLAKEWHPRKNHPLNPSGVSAASSKEVWWQCGKSHEWQASISNRRTRGCPYCSNRRAGPDNCLAVLKPLLAQEWHPGNNGPLTPNDVVPGSQQKVWWLCKGGHSWRTTVNHRTQGTGCPKCSRSRAGTDRI